tara:strand:+ start:530 stop:1576 length:1047 start_codon:yes stop_codon:yes gene_type:complete
MIEKIKVKPTISIKEAMQVLNETVEKCLLVVDESNILLGTLTDGDLRRSILAGSNFSENISSSFNEKPIFLEEDDLINIDCEDILNQKNVDLIPVLDKKKVVINFISRANNSISQIETSLSGVSVVIMAGGKGSRLKPFTDILPKPLVPVHDKPIIEHIIEKFTYKGCKDFYITINYKGKILKAYFDELNTSYTTNFVEESEFLGTAGSLKLVEHKMNSPFFVSNCDIIIKSDYFKIYEFHNKNKFDVTIVASAKEYVIPYGTCELDSNGNLSHINEKPSYDFLINTGFYVINPDILKLIPKNKFYHITHLIEDAKNNGMRVGVYPVSDDSWIDIGQWKEYKDAIKRF